MPSQMEVTAKFLADITDFQSKMREMKAAAKEVQTTSKELAAAMKESGQGLDDVGSSGNKAADGVKKVGGASREAGMGLNEMVSHTSQTISDWQQLIQVVGQFIQWIGQARDAAMATATAFTYLTGSEQKAQQELAKLQSTWSAAAFGTQAIDNVAQHFLMLGKNAQTTEKEIGLVSDAIAAMGGDAKQITPVIESLHKIQGESRVTKEEIDNLAREGIASWDALAAGMSGVEGKTVSVAEAQKRVVSGAVSGKEAYQDMMQGMITYTGAAEQKSQSLGAEWQRLGENASKAFGPLADLLAQDLEQINELIEGTSRLSDAFKAVGSAMSSFGAITMPHYAGGITDSPVGHFATVGEQGPETMFIPQGASIIPNGVNPFSSLAGGMSSSSGSSVLSSVGSMSSNATINITHQIYLDSRVIAQQTIPHIAPITRSLTGRRT